ncbi:MAG: MFS transporter [Chloroflexi bacterium]|nr:MFS transporter [Chloroflexota bacterium]
MIFTLVPLFLVDVIGAGATIIGFVGGLSESTDAFFKVLSGWFSDKTGRRKRLAVWGYSLSTLAKPFMYLASTWVAVAAIRFGDRVGKGIRGAPRDALVADSVPAGERGKGFGLHRTMDTFGAVLGLAVAALIIYLVQGGELELSLKSYRWLVIIGTVPAILAVLVLIFFVRETGTKPLPASDSRHDLTATSGFDTRFKVFLGIMALFTLGNSSDFFVILRAQNLEASVVQIAVMLVLLNITCASISLPAGVLSDRVGRRRVIAAGWSIYALVYLGFALATSLWQIWLLFAAYGVYYGVIEGVARAFVADLVAPEKRGTAFGLYHGVIGLALLAASVIAGFLWETISPAAPFFFGAGLAFTAMLSLIWLIRE